MLFLRKLCDGALLVGEVFLVIQVEIVGGDAENLKPLSAYSFCSSISQGVSILQGPHHVAQKLMSSGFAFEARKRDLLAAQIFQHEIRSRLADQR